MYNILYTLRLQSQVATSKLLLHSVCTYCQFLRFVILKFKSLEVKFTNITFEYFYSGSIEFFLKYFNSSMRNPKLIRGSEHIFLCLR